MEQAKASIPTMSPSNCDVPIKYESPYSTDPIPDNSPQSSPLKRQRSSEILEDTAEKRQRIDCTAPMTPLADFAAILAQATASVTEHYAASSSVGLVSQSLETSIQQYSASANTAPVQGNALGSVNQDNSDGHVAGTSSDFSSDPHLYMRILSLPILESLSTQILATLSQGPYSETIKIATDSESGLGQAYATLKSLFDQTKKIYSQQEPFLSADKLNIQEPEHRATIRTTNLATFLSSVFGGQDVGFYELNDHFIEIFTPEGQELQMIPGQLFLNLKTQMYISAISQEYQERSKDEMLEDLFPAGAEDLLASRHPGTQLSQSEKDFLSEAKSRREYLLAMSNDVDSIKVLSDKYAWEDFLESLSTHLSETYKPLIAPYMKRHALTAPVSPTRTMNHSGNQQNSHNEHKKSNVTGLDISEDAARAAQEALRSLGYGGYPNEQNGGPQQPSYQQPHSHSFQPQYTGGPIPYHTQSAPTQVLYEQARQAAVAKANPSRGRPGLPSQRRPWSTEEENALMAGLDQVKGPHWSQILALYGPKGQVSEILKDRNQVQLKDKARNLKLFFLKSNIEVPYYLQCVTGELKTRAPGQAARKEAEERSRLASDEEQARFNGIMTLAGGIHAQSDGLPRESSEQSNSGSPEDFQAAQALKPFGVPLPAPTPSPLSDDEEFRQRLMAANEESQNTEQVKMEN